MARRVSGGSKLRRQLRMLERAHMPGANAELTKAITVSAKAIADEMATRAPKDQGDLAHAVTYKVSSDGLGASIGYSNKKAGFKIAYRRGGFAALFQEFGTRHHAAQPFIRPAYRATVKQALDEIERAVKSTIKRIIQS